MGRAEQSVDRLPRYQPHRMDGAFRRRGHRVEPDQGAGRHDDLAAMRAGEFDKFGTRQQRTGAQHHDLFAGAQHRPADLIEDRCRCAFDDEVGVIGQLIE